MHFASRVESARTNATGIEVPAEVVSALAAGARPPVTVTVNGYTYRTSIGVMGGRSLLPLSAEHRAGSGLAAGDEVDVEIEVDTAPRTVDVPADLGAALAEAGRRGAFDRLSYSQQRQHVLAVEAARTEATRQRRIDGVLAKLAD